MPDQQFLDLTNQLIVDLKSGLDPVRRQMADNTEWLVWDEPNEYYLKGTGTGPGYILLGAYEDTPHPRISLFESSLHKIGGAMGGLAAAVKDTVWHEFWQHRAGLDHTRETIEMGLIPALMVPYAWSYGGSEVLPSASCVPCHH